ncbi:Armadillo-type fold [Pseudocohnilembus persalinus]|uniref:Armadillo-type fold n=1 Tax=Pseudocohnilembus persalinus TaxID=266149 RepID=A0A0V0QP07_PSEPJ|nr:Armadillo-type fold [Pseudocohnilembus persalinus]KRX03717.1 Armadillo-type fold [Pseudocohnilembus persalinus]|eukprot:KRX01129.1 Armadillo-type fold [Pseudocohnilembus persalinus]
MILIMGSDEQIDYLYENYDLIEVLSDGLNFQDYSLLLSVLNSVYKLLEYGKNNFIEEKPIQNVKKHIKSFKIHRKIENLQNHKNQDVYNLAFRIIDSFFLNIDHQIEIEQPENQDNKQGQKMNEI